MILDVIAAVFCISIAFAGGYLLAEREARLREAAVKQALAEVRERVQPVPKQTLPNEFFERLEDQGKATVQLRRQSNK